jgi:hypothetical protein
MSDEIYEHMPKWRRLIRDLARDAGIKNFLNHSHDDASNSTEANDSSTGENQPEHGESERR